MVGPIVGTAVRIGGNIAMRTLAAEGAILGKAWWGFKKRREIVAGIRTGLGLGAGIGSFINNESSPFDNAQVPFVQKTNKFRQKYNRRNFSRGSSRYNNRRNTRCRCKQLRRRSYRNSYRR